MKKAPQRLLMFMYYTVCCFTGIFYAAVRQISMLFIDNKDSVFCVCFDENHSTCQCGKEDRNSYGFQMLQFFGRFQVTSWQ